MTGQKKKRRCDYCQKDIRNQGSDNSTLMEDIWNKKCSGAVSMYINVSTLLASPYTTYELPAEETPYSRCKMQSSFLKCPPNSDHNYAQSISSYQSNSSTEGTKHDKTIESQSSSVDQKERYTDIILQKESKISNIAIPLKTAYKLTKKYIYTLVDSMMMHHQTRNLKIYIKEFGPKQQFHVHHCMSP